MILLARAGTLVIGMTALLLVGTSRAFVARPSRSFVSPRSSSSRAPPIVLYESTNDDGSDNNTPMDPNDVLNQAIALMSGGGATEMETPDMVQGRIQNLVDEHKVLLFLKGSKAFPQCGFSDTACKILERYQSEIDSFEDYHSVDVLADPLIREGIKQYSQWPTIPQLYLKGEFVGGSDIMLELYESGELQKLIQNAVNS